jgi:flagellar biosynthesis protein FlhG
MINDQAAKLRDLAKFKSNAEKHLRPVRRIAVTSGKGGVGKSNVSLNLGICFQKMGRRALLVDADLNLANIDILLGITPKYTLADAVLGDRFLKDILVEGPEGLRILPAGSGVIELLGLDSVVQDRLEHGMAELEAGQDLVILDTGAGISEGVVEFASGADDIIVVTTPEPTAITDAYAAIKVISSRNVAVTFHLLVNFAQNKEQADDVARKIKLVVQNYLALDIDVLGHIPVDIHIPQAVAQQKPLLQVHPRSPAARHLEMIARRLLRLPASKADRGSIFHQIFRRGG